jgi:L-malate glycosyltransferase
MVTPLFSYNSKAKELPEFVNILHVTHLPPDFGGTTTMSLQIGMDQKKMGHTVGFIGYVPGSYIPQTHLDAGLKFMQTADAQYGSLAGSYGFNLPGAIFNAAKSGQFKPHVIHAHYATDHLQAAILARDMIAQGIQNGMIESMTHAPAVITTMHGTDVTVNGTMPEIGATTKYLLSQSDGLTFVSKDLQRQAQINFELPDSESGYVVYNYIDDELFNANLRLNRGKTRSEIGVPQDTFLFYHVSNMLGAKRPEFAIEAYSLARKHLPENSHFLIVGGEGKTLDEKRKLASDLGVLEHMTFLGKKDQIEVAKYTACGDCMLLPSAKESFGLVNLESMAVQNPIIASRVGGIPEVVKDTVTGELIDPQNPMDMAQDMIMLARNPENSRSMGMLGHTRWRSNFSPIPVIEGYEAVYREAFAKRNFKHR